MKPTITKLKINPITSCCSAIIDSLEGNIERGARTVFASLRDFSDEDNKVSISIMVWGSSFKDKDGFTLALARLYDKHGIEKPWGLISMIGR